MLIQEVIPEGEWRSESKKDGKPIKKISVKITTMGTSDSIPLENWGR